MVNCAGLTISKRIITNPILLIRVSPDEYRVKIDEAAKFLFTASNDTLIEFLSAIFSLPLNKETLRVVPISTEYISHCPVYSRHYPDIVLEVRGLSNEHPLFHVEIQTGYNSMMDVRMVKYGYLIGESRSEIDSDNIRVITIPHQVVIYLEEHNRINDTLQVKIVLPDGSDLLYSVPVLKLYQYPVEVLRKTDLYLLLPLVLVKYRKRFELLVNRKHSGREEFDQIVGEIIQDIETIISFSSEVVKEGRLDEETKDIILSTTIEMYKQLHRKYIKDERVQGKVENMIESVRQKWHTIGLEEGIEKGIEKGIEQGVKTVAKNLLMIGIDDAVILQVTGLTPEELERIKGE